MHEQQTEKRRKVATDDVRTSSAAGASVPVTSVAANPTAQLDDFSDETVVEIHMDSDGAVSYTHLTLPTIYSV